MPRLCLEEVASFPLEGSNNVISVVALPGGRIATGHSGPDNTWLSTIRVWTTSGDLVATLKGHTGTVRGLASTPSGDIVSGSSDNTVKVWRDYACVHTLNGHTKAVAAVAVSPLDDFFFSASFDHTAKVWSASTGECVATLEGHAGPVKAVCVLNNGDIVTGSADKTLRVWARGSWACTAVHEANDSVFCVVAVSGGGFAVGGGTIHGPGFVSQWRGGAREWVRATPRLTIQLAIVQRAVVAGGAGNVQIIQGGRRVKQLDAEYARVAAISNTAFAVIGPISIACKVYRVVRRSRIAAIHILITAWSAHGGTPPPASSGIETAAVALARTLSLRRLCRPRGGGSDGSVEVMEPFGRDVVGFM